MQISVSVVITVFADLAYVYTKVIVLQEDNQLPAKYVAHTYKESCPVVSGILVLFQLIIYNTNPLIVSR